MSAESLSGPRWRIRFTASIDDRRNVYNLDVLRVAGDSIVPRGEDPAEYLLKSFSTALGRAYDDLSITEGEE